MSKLMTVKETAGMLSVSVSTTYQLIEQGKLACYRIGAGRGSIRVCVEDVELYLASCRSTPEKKTPPAKGLSGQLSHLTIGRKNS